MSCVDEYKEKGSHSKYITQPFQEQAATANTIIPIGKHRNTALTNAYKET